MTTHPQALDIDAEIDSALPQCPICDGPVVAHIHSFDGGPGSPARAGGQAICCRCGHVFWWHQATTVQEVRDLIVRDLKPVVIG